MTAALIGDELIASLEPSLAELLPTVDLLDRAAADAAVPDDLRTGLVDLGLLESVVSQAHDGLGLVEAEVAAVWRVAGRRLLPTVFREEALTLVPTLELASADDPRARNWLASIRSGAIRGGGRVLVGSLPTSGEIAIWAEPGARIVALVGRDAAVLYEIGDGDLRPSPSVDPGQALMRFQLGLRSASATLRGRKVGAIWQRVQLAALAESTGAAERALEMSVEFAKMREQFGRPIARFQAVAHRLADMRVSVEASKSLMARLCEVAGTPLYDDLLAVARYTIPEAARTVCEGAIQVHGGTGFTWEYGLHLYYRRVLQIQAMLGGAETCARDLGARYLEQVRT